MRIAESFCKMRLSEYCSSQDIDRAIAVTVESFIGSQKVSAKKALSRAFAKYVIPFHPGLDKNPANTSPDTHSHGPSHNLSAALASPCQTHIYRGAPRRCSESWGWFLS